MTVIYCPALRGLYDFDNPVAPTLPHLAKALSLISRWNGPGPSVLEHSLRVGKAMEAEGRTSGECLAGYLHDAFECVTGDMPTPIKSRYLTGIARDKYEGDETNFLMALYKSLGWRPALWEFAAVKTFDQECLVYECQRYGYMLEGDWSSVVPRPSMHDVDVSGGRREFVCAVLGLVNELQESA